MNLVEAGGPIVIILIAMSVITLTIALAKTLQLAQSGALWDRSRDAINASLQYWKDGDPDRSLEALAGQSHPQAKLLAHASVLIKEGKLQDQALREEVARFGSLLIQSLQSYLRPLEVIATLAPLIGLLGTVAGMIEAFQAMEAAGKQVDPSILSGGIWQALLTTAVGLIVAIPASLIHSWFERKTETIASRMSDSIAQLFTLQAEKRLESINTNGIPFPRAAAKPA